MSTTRTSGASARRPARRAPGRGRAAALVVLAVAAGVCWWPVLGPGLLWAAPAVVLAGAVAAGSAPPRAAAVGVLAWLLVAPLLAGVPAAALGPRALGSSWSSLASGLEVLGTPEHGRVTDDPWPLAGALIVGGATWLAAGALATRRGLVPATAALAVPAFALIWALALEQTTDAAWPGAALVAAGVLWAARGRLTALVPAVAVVAVVAAGVGQAVGPEEQWVPFAGLGPREPQFSRLDITQSYGPLRGRRTGATMLEVRSPVPALWRAQTLERFGGRWSVERRDEPDLPQPAAETVTTQVTVRGLQNRHVVAPGRIVGVDAERGAYQDAGEARQLRLNPRSGDTYRVRSEVVQVTAAELRDVPVPRGARYEEYTETWNDTGYRRRRGRQRPAIELYPRLHRTYGEEPFVRVLGLAQRLAAGAGSQLAIVRRVQSWLLDGGRYRYTTDVPVAGAQPLVEFLLDTRAGYCQQFAGAAAMLLRLAGVPTRVATGFATGEARSDGTYVVRDEDAHAWIEVYFPGFGWVPFNPTPPDAAATVDARVDVLADPSAGATRRGGTDAALLVLPLGALVVAGAVGIRVHRRRRDADPAGPVPTGELLARIATGGGAPGTTLRGLRPGLLRVGPAVAALADEVERARFSGATTDRDRRPRLRVWRALRRDVGPARATALIARHGLRRAARGDDADRPGAA